MKHLKTISLDNATTDEIKNFRKRKAARAIVFDGDKKIGLLHVTKYNYHKLPGGGVKKEEENIQTTLKRECLEEIGCNIKISGALGSITEYRKKFALEQTSYCYLAEVIGDKRSPMFTQEEIDDGFEIKWVSLSEAIKLLENDTPDDYEGKFIQLRDLTFLKSVKKEALE